MQTTGSDVLIKSLIQHWVDTIFGYPWGAVIPVYDRLNKYEEIKHVLVRHEQGTTFGAGGYARSTWKVWVALTTSGPWTSNALTGLLDAYMDSIPLLLISWQVHQPMIGTDAFQEMDTIGATMSMVKHSLIIRKVEDIPQIVYEALTLANSWRPWPVHIEIPKDISSQTVDLNTIDFSYQEKNTDPVFSKTAPKLSPTIIQNFQTLLTEAKRPILLEIFTRAQDNTKIYKNLYKTINGEKLWVAFNGKV